MKTHLHIMHTHTHLVWRCMQTHSIFKYAKTHVHTNRHLLTDTQGALPFGLNVIWKWWPSDSVSIQNGINEEIVHYFCCYIFFPIEGALLSAKTSWYLMQPADFCKMMWTIICRKNCHINNALYFKDPYVSNNFLERTIVVKVIGKIETRLWDS